MIAKFRRYIGWALLGLLVLWIFFNLQSVRVNLFIMRVDMPVAFVIVFSGALGAAGMYLLRIYKKVKGDEKK